MAIVITIHFIFIYFSFTPANSYLSFSSRRSFIPLCQRYECYSCYNSNVAIKVVAKKIVTWLRFSLSQSYFFVRDLKQNFVPHLLQHLECWATKQTQYMESEHAKCLLKTRFQFNYFITKVAPILKIVRNICCLSQLKKRNIKMGGESITVTCSIFILYRLSITLY